MIYTLLALLLLLPSFASGRSLLTTRDGTRILGDVEQEQFDLTTVAGDAVIIPRAALDHLRVRPDGIVEVTLKDGKSLAGALAGELIITDGLIKRRIQATNLARFARELFQSDRIREVRKFPILKIHAFKSDQAAIILPSSGVSSPLSAIADGEWQMSPSSALRTASISLSSFLPL